MNPVYYFLVPYRNRPDCLKEFLVEFPKYLLTQDYIEHFKVLIVEQDERRPFNLGYLMNVGFSILKKSRPVNLHDIIYYHPVDTIPLNINYEFSPIARSCWIHDSTSPWQCINKIIGINVQALVQVNGWNNGYWGYGHEDLEFRDRLELVGQHRIEKDCRFRSIETTDEKGKSKKEYQELNRRIYEMFLRTGNMTSGLSNVNYSMESLQIYPPYEIEHFKVNLYDEIHPHVHLPFQSLLRKKN